MPLAIAFAFEARVLVLFVDTLSFKICKPGFNVPGRDDHRHSSISSTPFFTCFSTGAFNLFDSGSNVSKVSVDQHNQCLFNSVFSSPVVRKLFCVSLTHELLARASALRADFDPLNAQPFACSFEKPASKCLVLTILA